jgi:hypothetical protein
LLGLNRRLGFSGHTPGSRVSGRFSQVGGACEATCPLTPTHPHVFRSAGSCTTPSDSSLQYRARVIERLHSAMWTSCMLASGKASGGMPADGDSAQTSTRPALRVLTMATRSSRLQRCVQGIWRGWRHYQPEPFRYATCILQRRLQSPWPGSSWRMSLLFAHAPHQPTCSHTYT